MAKQRLLSDNLREIASKPWGQFLILLVIILASHVPLLFVKQIENPDAGWIYENLESFGSLSEYFKALVDFRTYDFQPVRDLTFYLDIFVFRSTGYVISIVINSLIWAATCFLVLKILMSELNERGSVELFFLVCCFAVYPVFQVSVNWGIARKHLLSFFFILLATNELLSWEKKPKSLLPLLFFYTLSVLSLPINICWPLWVFCREGGWKTLKDSRLRPVILGLGLISLLLAAINYAYYKTSYVFLETYTQKAAAFDFTLLPLNIGLQFRQMLFPYIAGIFQNFGESSVVFFGVFLIFIAGFVYYSRRIARLWMWPLFGALPMFVTLTTPQVYFDTYVLVPTFSLFMLLMTNFFPGRSGLAKFAVIPFLIWFGFTWKGSTIWASPVAVYEEGFIASPNCTNARTLGYRYYKSGKKLPTELYDFIQVNKCLEASSDLPPNLVLKIISFEAMSLYYEDEIDSDYRMERLKELSQRNLFPFAVYISYLAKTGEADELEELLRQQNEILKNSPLTFQYEFILAERVPAFCRDHHLVECEKYLARWAMTPKPEPYF